MSDFVAYLSYFVALLSVLAAAYTAFEMRRARIRLRQQQLRIGEAMHSLSDIERDQAGDLLISTKSGKSNDQAIYRVLVQYLDCIQSAVASISSGDIDCSIKLMGSSSSDTVADLFTVARNSSSENREISRLSYPILANPPYEHAVIQQKTSYVKNVTEPSEGGFVTREPVEWKQHIRSVIAIPIITEQQEDSATVIGVLTVESTQPNAFPDPAVLLAKNASDWIRSLLGMVTPREHDQLKS